MWQAYNTSCNEVIMGTLFPSLTAIAGVNTRILLSTNKATSRYEAGYVLKHAVADIAEEPQESNEQPQTSAVPVV
jgi:hypothetical protein